MTVAPKSAVALIPARAGSKRLPSKNVRLLAGHPLLAYTIAAALESDVFSAVVVSTDSEEYAAMATRYGAEVPFLRPADLAGDHSPDIEWVAYTLRRLADGGRRFDCFSILRPTNPFRSAETIRSAWRAFSSDDRVDSLRAVELCEQHPGKMWVVRGNRMNPLLPFTRGQDPWHSCPYQALPEIYAQNASLEIAWTRTALEQKSIAGSIVLPFITQGVEGFDLNTPVDWLVAEALLSSGEAVLPSIAAVGASKPSSSQRGRVDK